MPEADETFRVRVEGVQFAAGHFATFGGVCEPLHGHNYTLSAEVEGVLSTDAWVVDFVALKALLRRLADQLDHRFMLQRDSRVLGIEATTEAWQVTTPAGASYLLPQQDVVALPIDNSTAERLAQWFAAQVWQELAATANLSALEIDVSEGPEQHAIYRRVAQP